MTGHASFSEASIASISSLPVWISSRCHVCGAQPTPAIPLTAGAALAALTLLLVWLGVYPAPLAELVRTMVAGL